MDSIRITDIIIPAGRRDVNEAKVAQLADSIRDVGLLNPITVTKNGILLAGLNRMRAVESLGEKEIACTRMVGLDPDLMNLVEIDENFMRQELTVLERADLVAKRKPIYARLHPEVKPQGGRPSTSKTRTPVSGFSHDTAKATGVSERTVQRDVEIGTNLTPEAKEAARGTPVEKSTSKLLEVARLPEEEQPAEVRRMIEESLHPTPRASSSAKASDSAEATSDKPEDKSEDKTEDEPTVDPAFRERYFGALEELHEAVRITEDGEDVTAETLAKAANSLTAMGQGRLSSWMEQVAYRWARGEAARLVLRSPPKADRVVKACEG